MSSLHPFSDKNIQREYDRWMKKIGEVPQESAGENLLSLSIGEVLRAHFFIAEFFADEKNGLGGVGPRDKEGHLLHSALSRQFVGYGNERKWTDNYQIAATVLFGLVKNHPFHDGNKRTALLSILHLLEMQGRTTIVDKREWEKLVVSISDNHYRRNILYKYLRDEKVSADDADVGYISYKLKKMTRTFDRSRRALTYWELNRLLRGHGFEMLHPQNNQIDIVRIEDDQTVGHVGFPGMKKQLAKSDIKKIRGMCSLSEADGYDSKAFFNGGVESMEILLSEYDEPLRRLADK